MDQSYALQELAASPFFKSLPSPLLERLAARGRLEYFSSGTGIFEQGAPATHFFLLVSGRVALQQSGEDGNQTILRFLGPGDVFAGVAVLPEAVYPATAEAVERSGTLAWEHSFVNQLAQTEANFAYALLGIAFARLNNVQSRMREMAFERTERRIALTITRLTGQMGTETDEGIRIDLRLTRQMLADMAGTTLFSASRILSRWEKDGLIRSTQGTIIVLEPHRLIGMAHDLIQKDSSES